MKAEEFFEEQMANIRELWHLSDLQKNIIFNLMEEYAALHIADFVGQSKQLCPDCGNTGRRLPQTLDSPDGLECECGAGA